MGDHEKVKKREKRGWLWVTIKMAFWESVGDQVGDQEKKPCVFITVRICNGEKVKEKDDLKRKI